MNPKNLKQVIDLNEKIEILYKIKLDISKQRISPLKIKRLSDKDKELQNVLKDTNTYFIKEIMNIYKQLESL